jgi:polyadenylate-binding protein
MATATATPVAAPAANATPYASASLYVGELSLEVTEALLFEMFNAVGPVASVRVCRDAATRRSLGYAYVNFHRVEDAERALDTMNFTLIRNKPCRIMWSHRDPSLRKSGYGNIFVKNLATNIDNKALYDTFSIFGNILSCKVATNHKRESLGYGFVHYESDDAAATAISRVNGMVIAGQKVTVAAFKSKKERGGNDKVHYSNLYVKNLPEDFNKEKFDALFSKYGEVTSSVVAMSEDGKSKGFGFINYLNPEDASAAVNELNNADIGGKKLFVGRAQKREEREKELRDRFEQVKAERQKKYAGVNLYVKNLSDNIDDQKLIQEFSKYGEIKSARVMSEDGKSRGFGFVCFATPEEATKAVSEMNGKMVDSKPLYVALAQRKDVRRAQLEAQYAAKRSNIPVAQPMYQGAPLYYQGMPQRLMYPQAAATMVPRRNWNPQAAGAQNQPQGGRPQQMMGMQQYIGMPPGGIARGMGPRGGRGSRGGQTQGGVKQGGRGRAQGQPMNGQNGQPNFKYTQNARNQQGSSSMHPAVSAQPISSNASLTTDLVHATPEQQKQIIGERLFPLVQSIEPKQAGKVTGMLLEMEIGETIHLLESAEALDAKVKEAVGVLQDEERLRLAGEQRQEEGDE